MTTEAESVNYEDGVIERTLKVSDGDLRRALNLLQSAARLSGASAPVPNERSNGHSKKIISDDSDDEMEDVGAKPTASGNEGRISVSDIDDIAGTFPPVLTENLIKILQKGNARNYNNVANAITNIVASVSTPRNLYRVTQNLGKFGCPDTGFRD